MELYDKVERAKVDELIPYYNNPKEHPEEQVEKIASSIEQYGFTQPVVIADDNEIIIGHGRVEAAKKLGLEEVPAIVRDDLSLEEMKALRLADNKIAESGWNMEQLEVELETIDFEELETGFDEGEIGEILEEIDFIDNSLQEDDRGSRTGVGKGSMVVSIGTLSEVLEYDLVQEVMNKIEEKFEEDKIRQFMEWFLNEG